MATLYQLLKVPALSSKLSLDCVEFVLTNMFTKLIDERLTSQSIEYSDDLFQMVTNLTKGVNMIALKLTNELSNSVVICVLLRISLQCALFNSSGVQFAVPVTQSKVPSACAQPISRLLLHTLSDEVSQDHPFSPPGFDIHRYVSAVV